MSKKMKNNSVVSANVLPFHEVDTRYYFGNEQDLQDATALAAKLLAKELKEYEVKVPWSKMFVSHVDYLVQGNFTLCNVHLVTKVLGTEFAFEGVGLTKRNPSCDMQRAMIARKVSLNRALRHAMKQAFENIVEEVIAPSHLETIGGSASFFQVVNHPVTN